MVDESDLSKPLSGSSGAGPARAEACAQQLSTAGGFTMNVLGR